MEIIIVLLLGVLIVLVAGLLWKMRQTGENKDRIESVLNEKFIDFSERIRQTMDKTREEVSASKDILSKNAIKTLEHISGMHSTVGNLVRQQEKAQQLGQSLEYLLQAPKLRGNYGETILEEMLDKALPKGIWQKQYAVDGVERVDAIIKYRDVIIPIDSKFPRDDYQKYLSASNPNEKKAHWANYEKALKIQINSIKDKYIKPEKGTAEFALLFIPSESIYYETIAEKNHMDEPCQINEYAHARKVIPVSPNTFYAFLQIILLGIRNIEIAKNAKKLQEQLTKIERDFAFFYAKFEVIGKSLEKSQEAYKQGEEHIQRFKRTLDSTLKMDVDEKSDAQRSAVLEKT